MKYYAGLDIGGTNGRLKLISDTGALLGEFNAPGCSVNTDGWEKSRQRCRDLVLPNLALVGLNTWDCMGICAAVSGVDSQSIAKFCRDIFEEMGFLSHRLEIVNDCEVFLHLSKGPAMVLISGTGSICFGRDGENQVCRTGGWNHIISDEGSGFDLGLRVLKAAADDLDGRKKAPVLTAMIIEESGLDSLEKLNDFINGHLFEKAVIARFARTGYEAAKLGDEESLKIHADCADMLYQLVEDTLRKMDAAMQLSADLWLWGSVLVKNDIISRYLSERIESNRLPLKVKIPEVSALDTAVLVAMNIV